MEGFGVRNFSSSMSHVVYGWKFLKKRRSSPSLDHTIGPSVSNFAYINLYCSNIIHRTDGIIKCVSFKLPLFANFSPVDLERLRYDHRWLSDAHLTLALRWVPLSLFKCINLIYAVIVFWIVRDAIFGGIGQLNSWTPCFGHS